jgi:PAS domain S-box-containing protein
VTESQPPHESAAEEVESLRHRLEDLLQAMDAIRGGDVDAVVVGGPEGEQLYTQYSADRPYRVIVEEMGDGAVTVSERGVILYANDRMAKLLGRERAGLLGADVAELVTGTSAVTLAQLMDAGPGATRRAELELCGTEEGTVPVLASVTGLDIDGMVVRCLIVADLTDERRAAAAVSEARQQMLRQQLELQQEHRLNDTLQRAVLPGRLPEACGLRLAARYLPADRPTLVGGDWYDAFALPSGQVALAVGDVVGHGLEAAAMMGQARNALRAYAFADGSPATVLERLNTLTVHVPEGVLATAVFGLLDVGSRTFRWANAGHPPPVLIGATGPRLLAAPPGMMVGADAEAAYGDATEQLAVGDLLVLYSDGLIERRSSDLDADTDALLAAAADLAGNDAEQVCAALISRLVPASGPEDDVCLLVLEIVSDARP